jgi:glyoxylase-like metal-dependent hydrolase (beta-lactamase superfamily II)
MPIHDVTVLLDGIFEAPSERLIHQGGEAQRQAAMAALGPKLRIPVHCFLLRGPAGLVLVDAGTGPSWGAQLGHAWAALAALGVAPAEITHVVLTHIHGDHALGALDGEAAYFPNAQIIAPQADLAYFTDEQAKLALPEARRGGFAIAAALQRAYGDRLRTVPPGAVLPGLEYLPLPGHTPGHSGVLVDGALLLWGDLAHLPAQQVPDPDLGVVFDLDPAMAARTRHALLPRAAAAGWTIHGGHTPDFCRVEAAPGGYRLTTPAPR